MTIEETIKQYETRMKENPKSLIFARLSDLYIREGKIDEAIQLCLDGINNHPSYVTGNFILAKAYLAKDESESAETELKKVLAHDRHHLSAHKLLGDLMAQTGWENKAILHYREILRIDPLHEETRKMLLSMSPGDDLLSERAIERQETESIETGVKTSNISDTHWGEQLDALFSEEERKLSSESNSETQPSMDSELFDTAQPLSEESVEQQRNDQSISNQSENPENGEKFIFNVPDETNNGEEEISPSTPSPNSESEIDVDKLLTEFSNVTNEKEEVPTESEPSGIFKTVKNSEDIITSEKESLPEENKIDSPLVTVEEETLIKDEKESDTTVKLNDEIEILEDEEETTPLASEDEHPQEEDSKTKHLFNHDVPAEKYEADTSITSEEESTDKKPLISEIDDHIVEKQLKDKPEDTSPIQDNIETDEYSKPPQPDKERKNSDKGIISPTLGEIYFAQGQYSKAIRVYKMLLENEPDNEKYRQKLEELKNKLDEN
jgi:tetratricopeptide (TPR) repeat protein